MVRLVLKNIFLILLNPNWTETWPELGFTKNIKGDPIKIYWHFKKQKKNLVLIFLKKN
jgi:hypothetical protein